MALTPSMHTRNTLRVAVMFDHISWIADVSTGLCSNGVNVKFVLIFFVFDKAAYTTVFKLTNGKVVVDYYIEKNGNKRQDLRQDKRKGNLPVHGII
jgi:hypothetical protein